MKRNTVLAAVMAAAALALSACGSGAGGAGTEAAAQVSKVIQVNSSETVKVEPDIAEIVLTVYSQATDAKTCQTQNSTDLERVISALTEQGIEETSIQTASFGLNPVYDWESGKTIAGYEMSTEVTVSGVPIDQAGDLLAMAVDSGVNQIDSVSYQCSSFDEKYKEALQMAIESAQVKARAMAEAGGCTLGEVTNIEELSSNTAARYTRSVYSSGAGEEAMAVDTSMNVMGGELEIEANVMVEFAIK